ncbi:hypothetical protein ACIBSW_30030 [Actinoplanes sp. NPDC049668]|uniref:hypothetical protein n=1 Tax=unclassified Actinoplanes TaxID=2626549 RepID=UPI0033ACD244
MPGALPVSGGHVEERPGWDCRACGEPWPCEPARKDLAAELSPTSLRIHMWIRLEPAALDLPSGTARELFDRFLRWTG